MANKVNVGRLLLSPSEIYQPIVCILSSHRCHLLITLQCRHRVIGLLDFSIWKQLGNTGRLSLAATTTSTYRINDLFSSMKPKEVIMLASRDLRKTLYGTVSIFCVSARCVSFIRSLHCIFRIVVTSSASSIQLKA